MNGGKWLGLIVVGVVVLFLLAIMIIPRFIDDEPENGSDEGAGTEETSRADNGDMRTPSTESREYDELPEPLRPDKVGAEILQRYYPEGRSSFVKVNGVAEGTGSHRRWGFQGNYRLHATSTHQVRWTVLRNGGEQVIFEVEIPVSTTLLWAAQQDYSIHPPDAPVLLALLRMIEPRTVVTIEEIWKFIQTADPNLRQSATTIKKWLEDQGYREDEIEQLGLKVRRAGEELQGITTRVTYRDGMGVLSRAELATTGDERLTKAQIEKIDRMLRQAHPVLVSYFLYPAQAPPGGERTDTDVGEAWTVDAKHLGGLFSPFMERYVSGDLTVRRQQDEEGRIVLEILDGEARYQRIDADEVDASVRVQGDTQLRLRPLEDGGYAIDQGEVNAEASLYRESLDHWLVEEQLQAEPHLNLRITGEPEASD